MPTSERGPGPVPPRTRGSAWSRRVSLADAGHSHHAAFPTSRAIRRLLVGVVAFSVVTLVVAVQALATRSTYGQAVAPVTAMVLMPVLWACSVGVYLSRRRSVLAYSQAWQRLTAFIWTRPPRCSGRATTDGVITYIGPRAQMVLGYVPEDLLGQGIDYRLSRP